jgi:hypothetical protein
MQQRCVTKSTSAKKKKKKGQKTLLKALLN